MLRKTRRGFSLLELLVVVAIVSILSAVAIPRFLLYALRSKTAEARTMLGTISIGQTTFFVINDCFAATEANPVSPPGRSKQVWDNSSSGDITMACDFGAVVRFGDTQIAPTSSLVYYQYQCVRQLSPPEFACNAVSDLDGDGSQAEWVTCSDYSDMGCISAPSGNMSFFPFEPVRVSGTLF